MIRRTLPPSLLASVVLLFASAALAAPAPSESAEVPIPKGAPPTLTVVRMTREGALVQTVAVPVFREEMVTVERVVGGKRLIEVQKVLVTSVHMVERTTVFKNLRASYANGTKVDPKKLAGLLAKRTLVLISHGEPVDPVYLRAFKDNTLVLIVPRQAPAPLDKGFPAPLPIQPKKLPK